MGTSQWVGTQPRSCVLSLGVQSGLGLPQFPLAVRTLEGLLNDALRRLWHFWHQPTRQRFPLLLHIESVGQPWAGKPEGGTYGPHAAPGRPLLPADHPKRWHESWEAVRLRGWVHGSEDTRALLVEAWVIRKGAYTQRREQATEFRILQC